MELTFIAALRKTLEAPPAYPVLTVNELKPLTREDKLSLITALEEAGYVITNKSIITAN